MYQISQQNTCTRTQLTIVSDVGLAMVGSTYTHSAGKSPFFPVRSQVPKHQPEFITVSPVSFSRMMRSPFLKLRNDELSAADKIINYEI